MKANVLKAVNDLQFIEYPLPTFPKDWVLVNVKAAGICGSDIARVFKTGTYHFPTIIGHEFSGVVSHVHEEDESLRGMRVSVFPLIPCKTCKSCIEEHYETCTNYNYLGSRCDGAFAEYVAVPKWNLLPIGEKISMESAAMFEPACVALHALNRISLKKDDNIVIIGPGTIGCIMAQLAKLKGAGKVIMVGRTQEKLNFVKEKFNVEIVNSSTDDVFKRVEEITDSKGIDIVVEGTGACQSLSMGLELVSNMGRILLMGNPLDSMNLSQKEYWKILRKQLTLVGTWNSSYGNIHSDWNVLKSLVEEEKLDLECLITHRFSLDRLKEGLEVMRDRNTYSNKVMIINNF